MIGGGIYEERIGAPERAYDESERAAASALVLRTCAGLAVHARHGSARAQSFAAALWGTLVDCVRVYGVDPGDAACALLRTRLWESARAELVYLDREACE